MKQTVAGFCILYASETKLGQGHMDFEMSCLFEAGDSGKCFLEYAKPHLDAVNALIQAKHLHIPGYGDMPFSVVGGGDQCMNNGMALLTGCNCSHPCGYCEVTVFLLCSLSHCFV